MPHAAKIICDSISPDEVRLTTFVVRFPRIVLAEFNTHRMFSRNSASSRAIPVKKMIEWVLEDPYIPSEWGKNQKGMQAGEAVSPECAQAASEGWLCARDAAVAWAEQVLELGIHKQLTNRLLEPFMWHTVIVTATEWSNFFHLRANSQAHPEIRIAAELMFEQYWNNQPRLLNYGEWHTPFVDPDESFDLATLAPGTSAEGAAIRASVGRCARVSYLTHDGERDYHADIALHDRLLESGHMSPFEHVARPADRRLDAPHALVRADDIEYVHRRTGPFIQKEPTVAPEKQWHGNFRGWVQYRKTRPNESDPLAPR